ALDAGAPKTPARRSPRPSPAHPFARPRRSPPLPSLPVTRRRSGANTEYACASRAPASRSPTNSISTRLATAPPARSGEIRADRLRGRRAQRLASRTRVRAQPADQRRRQPDGEHRRPLRHYHAIGLVQSHVHVPASLPLRQAELGLKRPHRIRRRTLAQQHHRAVDPHRVLVQVSPTERHPPVAYYKSRPTPSPRPADPVDQTLELKVRDCIQTALPPSITNRIACSRSRPRPTRPANSMLASRAFSVEPSHSPSGILTPSVVIPSATTWVRSAISNPSSIITAGRTSSSRRDLSSSSPVAVRSTNLSDTDVFDVAEDERSTSSPTGSPTTANLRVETPASTRSITARVSGSRSAKYSYVLTGSSRSSSAVRIRGRRTRTRRPPSV